MDLVIKDTVLGNHFSNFSKNFNVPNDFADIIIKAHQNGISNKGIRILGCICLNLNNRQIGAKKNDLQLQLFNDEWFSFDNDSPLGVDLSFKYSDFLPKGNKNTNQVKEGILELQSWLYTITFNRIARDGKTKEFSYRSPVISSFLTDMNSGFRITLNKYWYRLLIDLSKGFNSFSIMALFDLSFNSLRFYAYLLKLPQITVKDRYSDSPINLYGEKGTYQNKATFIETFELPYTSPSHIREKFLDRIKKELDLKMDWSFNYAFSNDDKKIAIVAYQTNNYDKEILSSPSRSKLMSNITKLESNSIRRSLTDKVKRYNLSDINMMILAEVYIKYSYYYTLKATNKKADLRGLTGNDYTAKFIEIVDQFMENNRFKSNFSNDEKLKIREHLFNKIKN